MLGSVSDNRWRALREFHERAVSCHVHGAGYVLAVEVLKTHMSANIDFMSVAPETANPLFEMGKLLAKSGLDPKLRTLLELRASQINGCAFCLALHHREATALGESNDRIVGLPAWREASWYTARERVALEWTETLTQIADEHPSDDLVARMKEQFTEREIVYVTLAITLINSWNRFSIAFANPPEGAEAVFKQLHPQAAAAAR
jgi:AhpD family alkylhydroperoxidase